MDTVKFNVPSISCSVCSGKIQGGLKEVNGIQNVSVDLKSQTVNVDYDSSKIQSQDIKKNISSMGYEVF